MAVIKYTVDVPNLAEILYESGVFGTMYYPWWAGAYLARANDSLTVLHRDPDVDMDAKEGKVLTDAQLGEAYTAVLEEYTQFREMMLDPEEIDSDAADLVIQTAVFGKVVFG